MRIRQIILSILLLVLIPGCTSFGHKTIYQDQYHYNIAINKALNEQMLLNLVQMRYGDSPLFLRVSSVVNSYSIEEQLSLLGSISFGGNDVITGNPFIKYTDRPTITYQPLLGEKFAKSLLVPIPDVVILSFVDMGWSADLIMRLCLRSINGISNRDVRSEGHVQVDMDFIPTIRAFRHLQEEKALRVIIRKTDAGVTEFLSFENRTNDPAIEKNIALVKNLLGLSPDIQEYKIGYRTDGSRDSEIIIKGRSLYEILESISDEIRVPLVDVEKKRVLATPDYRSISKDEPGPIIRIYSSPEFPFNAYIAIRYRSTWFYIDDSDFFSKKMFSVLMGLFMITESGAADFSPVLTIPAG